MATWFKTAAAGLIIIIGLVGSIWGLPKVFTTVERHEMDKEQMAEELAGVSINQQAIGTRSNIKWLQQEIYELEKKYGSEQNMPHDVRKHYRDLVQQLEDERKLYNDLRKQLKK